MQRTWRRLMMMMMMMEHIIHTTQTHVYESLLKKLDWFLGFSDSFYQPSTQLISQL